MTFWDFSRSPASINLLLNFGRTRGLAPAKLLAGTKLTLVQLDNAEIRVTPGQELGVIGNLLRLQPEGTGMGLQLGLTYHLSVHGVLGLGLMSSATPLDALLWGHRFLSLSYSYARITYSIEEDVVTILFGRPPALAEDLQAFVIERAIGAVTCILRDVAGTITPISAIKLSASAPNARVQAELRKQLGFQPFWEAGEDAIVLSLRALQGPSPQANATTAAMCQRMCEDLVESRRTKLGTATLVQDFLSAAPDDQTPTLPDMAALLCTSERTLKRLLQAEGMSFRDLRQASRLAKANHLLANPDNSLTEVAARLGFSDLSSFSQAYRRWTGIAPSASPFRASLHIGLAHSPPGQARTKPTG
jgi:AraC-like DNA-binding protein